MNQFEGRNLNATLLCRISSDKQAEGYSLDFQEKGGKKYAERQGLKITKTWRIIESASKESRREWEEYMSYATKGPEAHILVPKVDRSLRNFDDLAMISKIPKIFGKALHFFDDGIVFHKDSPASDLLRLGIQGTVATWYSVDLAQKTKRGLDEKASQGEWPQVAPFGYKNNTITHLIEVDPERAHWVRRIKELSAKGIYSLDRIKEILVSEGYPIQSHNPSRSLISNIIRHPIYGGYFEWPKGSGTLIKGKHEPLISWDLHLAAVKGLDRLNRPLQRKWNFPLAGLIRCGSCEEHRTIVFEIKKKKFTYAHCTGVRDSGRCPNPQYVPSRIIDEQIEDMLRGTQITSDDGRFILHELAKGSRQETVEKETQLALIRQEIGRLKTRIDKTYADKLDGKIEESFWAQNNRIWVAEKVRLEERAKAIEESSTSSTLPLLRTVLELSKNVVSLYNSADYEEKRELLNYTCSNFFLTGQNLSYSYKKPFDILAQGVKTRDWLPAIDTIRTWAIGQKSNSIPYLALAGIG